MIRVPQNLPFQRCWKQSKDIGVELRVPPIHLPDQMGPQENNSYWIPIGLKTPFQPETPYWLSDQKCESAPEFPK